MVVGAGDERGAAPTRVHHPQLQMEAREIDGRGEPGRAAADHQAIQISLGHYGSSAAPPRLFRLGRAPTVRPTRGADDDAKLDCRLAARGPFCPGPGPD